MKNSVIHIYPNKQKGDKRENLINLIKLYCKYLSTDHHKTNRESIISYLLHFTVPRIQYLSIYNKSIGITKNKIQELIDEIKTYSQSPLLVNENSPKNDYTDINQVYYSELDPHLHDTFDNIIQFKQNENTFIQALRSVSPTNHKNSIKTQQNKNKLKMKLNIKGKKSKSIDQNPTAMKYIYQDLLTHHGIQDAKSDHDKKEEQTYFKLLIENITDTKKLEELYNNGQHTLNEFEKLYHLIDTIEQQEEKLNPNQQHLRDEINETIEKINHWITDIDNKRFPDIVTNEKINKLFQQNLNKLNECLEKIEESTKKETIIYNDICVSENECETENITYNARKKDGVLIIDENKITQRHKKIQKLYNVTLIHRHIILS